MTRIPLEARARPSQGPLHSKNLTIVPNLISKRSLLKESVQDLREQVRGEGVGERRLFFQQLELGSYFQCVFGAPCVGWLFVGDSVI